MHKHHVKKAKKMVKAKNVPVEQPVLKKTSRIMKEVFRPKTKNQRNYVRAMSESDITFCYGPAGSGKTCCAVGLACEYLYEGKIDRIIITRPMIQCGRNGGGLGYLPGTVDDKFLPFMSPVLEEIEYFLGVEKTKELILNREIIVVPLELVKGKNFKKCFMICDEAENCEYEQIKTFMTRICEGTKCVFSGDIKQADINQNNCAFKNIMEKLEGVEGVSISKLDIEDIQRAGIVGRVLSRLES